MHIWYTNFYFQIWFTPCIIFTIIHCNYIPSFHYENLIKILITCCACPINLTYVLNMKSFFIGIVDIIMKKLRFFFLVVLLIAKRGGKKKKKKA